MDLLGTLGIGAIAVAWLGAVAAYVFEIRKTRWMRGEQSKNLASALHGEIGALRTTTVDRYMPVIRLAAKRIRAGREYRLSPAYTGNELFGVYRANVASIGTLPHPLPDLVADLYTRFLMMQEDLRTVVLPEWQAEVPKAQQVLLLQSMLERLGVLVDVEEHVRNELERFIETGEAPRSE